MKMDPATMSFDGKRMFWGGFKAFVELTAKEEVAPRPDADDPFHPGRPPGGRCGFRLNSAGYRVIYRIGVRRAPRPWNSISPANRPRRLSPTLPARTWQVWGAKGCARP